MVDGLGREAVRCRRRAAGAWTAIGALGLLSVLSIGVPPASGSVSCLFGGVTGDESGVVTTILDADGDSANIWPASGDVMVGSEGCLAADVAGLRATTANTDLIRVWDTSGRGSTALRIADPWALAPGATPEPGGSSEIELDVRLGGGGSDRLTIESTGRRSDFRLGRAGSRQGVNLNRGSERRGPADVDLTIAGVEELVLAGRSADDTIDAGGTDELARPLRSGMELFGFAGDDTLVGGDRRDILHGGTGEDALDGAGGRNLLGGGEGDDVLAGDVNGDRLDGGLDVDLADYRFGDPRSRGIDLDLRRGWATAGGRRAHRRASGGRQRDRLIDVEGAVGGPVADVLRGDGAINIFDGGSGRDVLRGRGSSDFLFGSGDGDRIVGGGARDVVLGGAGSDTIRGGRGKDVLLGGGGRDRVSGGGGVDVVDVSGGGRDVVRCGPGRDGVDADRRDRVIGCEVSLRIRDRAGTEIRDRRLGPRLGRLPSRH